MVPLVFAGLLALIAIIFVLRPLFGKAREPVHESPDSRRDALEREKEGVYLAIRELEFDHGTGVVSDEDHKRLMARYRARALSLIEAIDGLGGDTVADATESGAPGAECPACGAANAAGYRFCTRCGHEVPAPAPASDAPLPKKVGG